MGDERSLEEPSCEETELLDVVGAGAEGQAAPRVETVHFGAEAAGARLDRALTAALDPSLGLSRSRLRALIEAGCVTEIGGGPLRDPAAKVAPGLSVALAAPAPKPAKPAAQAIPLAVLHEDAALIVVVKPPGMAAHPAPGAEDGTLVNALLHHCGDSLSGIGGEARPGIVHRIDKHTSGLLVAAKTDFAHQHLSAQFAAHSIERAYEALVWGAPDRGDPRLAGLRGVSFARRGEADPALWGRIETQIARSASDRKKMAVVSKGGRRAVTWFQVAARFGAAARPAAAAIECRLETGRTHQIRVHLAYAGHGLIGDPSYGRASASRLDALPAPARAAAAGFGRQALHAGALGFIHPVTEAPMRFSAPPPEDHVALRAALEAL